MFGARICESIDCSAFVGRTFRFSLCVSLLCTGFVFYPTRSFVRFVCGAVGVS